jgi:serine protease
MSSTLWERATHGLALGVLVGAMLGPQASVAGSRGVATDIAQAALTDRLIVKYRARDGTIAAQHGLLHRAAHDAAWRRGVQFTPLRIGVFGAQVMRLNRALPHAEVQALARDIMASDPEVEYAEPDRVLHAQFTPNDTQYGQQWHYFEAPAGINLPAAWDKSTGLGVVVAVLDTGYRPHADLAANVLPGYDMIMDTFAANDGTARDNDARDPGDSVSAGACGGVPLQDAPSTWHGTHVAGTIAAVSNNGSGVAGVAFNAKVVPVRVLGRCGGYMSDVAAGIVWASGGTVSGLPANPNPARVINMSLSGVGGCDITSQNAINAARSRGTVVVVSAGNSNNDVANYSPASCEGVIAVAAVNRSGAKAYYSNYGPKVAVAAPGGEMLFSDADGVLSTMNSGATTPGADSYTPYQGTSMAAPHVAGVVALMLSKNPSLTPDDIAAKLKSTARPFPSSCEQCGTGIVNASAAVDAALGINPPPPPPTMAEVEPNDSFGTAHAVTRPVILNGTITLSRSGNNYFRDNDYFRVSVGAGQRFTATLVSNIWSDYNLYVYNASGTEVGRSLNTHGVSDSVSLTNTGGTAATYYVRVRYYLGLTGVDGKYTLTLD